MNFPNKAFLHEDFMVKKRKRSFSRDLRPESTTSARWTNIKNPKAQSRFAVGDRVAWDEGDCLILAQIVAFTSDACEIKVKLENGDFKIWPTISPRLRRIQTPNYDSGKSEATPIEPIGERLISEAYSSMTFEEEDVTQPVEKIDLNDTIAGDDWDE